MNDYNDYRATFYYILIRTTSNKPLIQNKQKRRLHWTMIWNQLLSNFFLALLALFCVLTINHLK